MAKKSHAPLMRVRYIKERDAFRIELSNDGEDWNFQSEFPCVACCGETESNFISYQFATTLRENLRMGFQLVL